MARPQVTTIVTTLLENILPSIFSHVHRTLVSWSLWRTGMHKTTQEAGMPGSKEPNGLIGITGRNDRNDRTPKGRSRLIVIDPAQQDVPHQCHNRQRVSSGWQGADEDMDPTTQSISMDTEPSIRLTRLQPAITVAPPLESPAGITHCIWPPPLCFLFSYQTVTN